MEQHFNKSLASKIYKRLLAEIISGELPAGEKLKETSLTKKLKVSRTPIREAIQRLTQEGLVEHILNYGCFVKKQNKEEIREIFECRQVLECAALEAGFDNISKEKLVELDRLISIVEKLDKNAQIGTSIKLDDKIHELVVELCPNKKMKDMLLKLQQQAMPFRTFRSLDQEKIAGITTERINIFKAIVDGDKAKAVQLLKEHILAAEGVVY